MPTYLSSTISLFQLLPLPLIVIPILFFLLLITKKNFNQPPTLPHQSHHTIFTIFTLIFGLLPAVYFGWNFYQLYFPDYRYEAASALVDFHIYQPQYLPPKVKQVTTFHQTNGAILASLKTIRATYASNFSQVNSDENHHIIVVDQSKVDDHFSQVEFNRMLAGDFGPSTKIVEHNLVTFPNIVAFSLTNQKIVILWLKTNDNVLVTLTSPSSNSSLDELIKIAESLH